LLDKLETIQSETIFPRYFFSGYYLGDASRARRKRCPVVTQIPDASDSYAVDSVGTSPYRDRLSSAVDSKNRVGVRLRQC